MTLAVLGIASVGMKTDREKGYTLPSSSFSFGMIW